MNGLSVMKRTDSTSISIFAVSSAIASLSGKPVHRPSRLACGVIGLYSISSSPIILEGFDLDAHLQLNRWARLPQHKSPSAVRRSWRR